VSDGSGALFSLSIATGLNPAIDKEKKRERTARPVIFMEGHAQMVILLEMYSRLV
jgi:hypothetical protein